MQSDNARGNPNQASNVELRAQTHASHREIVVRNLPRQILPNATIVPTQRNREQRLTIQRQTLTIDA